MPKRISPRATRRSPFFFDVGRLRGTANRVRKCRPNSISPDFSINSSACWGVGRPSCEAGRYPLCESWRLAISTRGNMRHR
jgi:hypothetical protein